MRFWQASCRVIVVTSCLIGRAAYSQESPAQETKQSESAGAQDRLAGLDKFIEDTMQQWKVPGLAVAIVQDGKVIHIKGYGVRDIEHNLPVTPKTLFAIGSISKSFTVTGLGMLADDGKLDWDSPIRSYLRDFQLYDRVATEQVTARDLVTHRTGLPRHDLVWYGDPSLGRRELFARLRFLEPSKEFRSTWQYQNLMFMTAGVLAEELSGKSWEDFTRARILEPLGMERTNFSIVDSQASDDFALPYTKAKDEVKKVPFHNIDAVGPAGSINSNVESMIKYVQFHIVKGKYDDKQLLSAAMAEQMQSPQMVMPSSTQSPRDEELGDQSYGMGLMISTYRGTKLVEHGGSIDGFVSLLSFLPRKKVGVIVLTNLSGTNPAPQLVIRRVYDLLLDQKPIDWAARIKAQVIQSQLASDATKKQGDAGHKSGTSPSHTFEDFTGSYQHPAYGTIQVLVDGSALRVTSATGISAALHHYHYDIFESDDDPTGRFDKRQLTFLYNKKGDIDRVTIPLEPAVADIVFTRLPDESLRQKSVLETLAGQYQLALTPITIALKDDHTLTLTVPGQPTYELVPTRNLTFDFKGLNGFSVAFRRGATGQVSEAVLFQPNGSFVAQRKMPATDSAGATKQSEPVQSSSVASVAQPNGAAARTPQPPPGEWSPELMMQFARIGNVRPSPDGKRVVYTVTMPQMTAERSEYVSQIHIANADGSQNTRLTYSDRSSSEPQWSPDGEWIAFLSDRSGKNNLYVLRTSGGEAERLTDAKSSITAFAWSPDGRQIAFSMADPASESEESRGKNKDDWRWFEEAPKMARLYVVPVAPAPAGAGGADASRPVRRLTDGNYHVAVMARAPASEIDWSPDSKKIVFSHRKSPKADDWTTSDVSTVDVATGTVTPLAATAASEFGAVYSPDGKSVAMLVSDSPPTWGGSYSIQIVPADGGTPRQLTATFDQQPAIVGWSADGGRIYFTEGRGTLVRVYAMQVATGDVEELSQGDDLIRGIELNRGRNAFGFTVESPQQAPEAYISGVERLKPARVSHANLDLPKPAMGKAEVIRWKSSDGMEIEGILTYPVGYQAGTRVPLLLQIHGGPMGVFQLGYGANPVLYPNAVFAARGFAILQPNPRGSSSYGKQFRYANYKDWGGGDFRDIMAGVDHVIALGVADPERLGVMGWSYGGYMTSWTITQTKRFKAASVGAGVTNLLSFTGTADIPGFLPDYLGSQPWDNLDLYRARSAVLNARSVTTPTLIQHGEADLRVPVSQGYELHNVLKQQGVATRMLVLPRQPHGPNEPKMMLKIMQTNLEWFEKYVSPKPAANSVGSAEPVSSDRSERSLSILSIDRFIESEMTKRNIPGMALAIVQNGKVVSARGYGLANVELKAPVNPETVFQLQSITKTFTATAIMMLVERGELALDDKIVDRLDNLPELWNRITIRQLLSHTSGIKDFINEPTVNLRLEATPSEIIKSLADKPLNFPPGDQFRYSNTGYQLLGMIIQKQSGKSWGDYLQDQIFGPLGMSDTRIIALNELIPNRAAGYLNIRGKLQNGNFVAPSILAYPGGGVRSTVLDLAKWDAALYTEVLLKRETLDQMWTPALLNNGSRAPYGLGWFLGNTDGHRLVQHTGSHMTGFGTIIARYPDDKITFIALTNTNGSNPTEIARGLATRYFAGRAEAAN